MTYVDAAITGLNWCISKPVKPIAGDCFFDEKYQSGYCYDGTCWKLFSSSGGESPKNYVPTHEQLQEHPSLKAAWDEYMVIRKLLGL